MALATPRSARLELGENFRCFRPAGLRWSISFISCAENCPRNSQHHLRPIVSPHVNLSVRLCTGDPLECSLGLPGPCCSRLALPDRDNESPSPECVHLPGRALCALDWCRSPRGKGSVQTVWAGERRGGVSAMAAAHAPAPKLHQCEPHLFPLATGAHGRNHMMLHPAPLGGCSPTGPGH